MGAEHASRKQHQSGRTHHSHQQSTPSQGPAAGLMAMAGERRPSISPAQAAEMRKELRQRYFDEDQAWQRGLNAFEAQQRVLAAKPTTDKEIRTGAQAVQAVQEAHDEAVGDFVLGNVLDLVPGGGAALNMARNIDKRVEESKDATRERQHLESVKALVQRESDKRSRKLRARIEQLEDAPPEVLRYLDSKPPALPTEDDVVNQLSMLLDEQLAGASAGSYAAGAR